MYYESSGSTKVYKAALTRREKADVSLRWIFISDVYVIEENGHYVNYFDRSEVFHTQESLGLNKNSSNCELLRSLKEYTYDELEVIENMLFNPNYCKDRLRVMEEAIRRGLVLSSSELDRYIEVLNSDLEFNDRYKPKVKQIV